MTKSLCVCSYVYIYICICAWMYMGVCVCVRACVRACVQACVCMCMCPFSIYMFCITQVLYPYMCRSGSHELIGKASCSLREIATERYYKWFRINILFCVLLNNKCIE